MFYISGIDFFSFPSFGRGSFVLRFTSCNRLAYGRKVLFLFDSSSIPVLSLPLRLAVVECGYIYLLLGTWFGFPAGEE